MIARIMKSCLFVVFLWVVFALSGCTSSQIPLNITDVSISSEPIAGQVVTLTVTVLANNDTSNATFTVDTLQQYGGQVVVVGGDVDWQGSLMANQPQTFQVAVCVLQEGSWPVEISVAGQQFDELRFGDTETIQLESTIENGNFLRGHEWKGISSQKVRTPTPTSRPIIYDPACIESTPQK